MLIAGLAHGLGGLAVVVTPEAAPLEVADAPAQITRWVEVDLPPEPEAETPPPEPAREPEPERPRQRETRPKAVKTPPPPPKPAPDPEPEGPAAEPEPAPEAAAAPEVLTQAPTAPTASAVPQIVSGRGTAAMVGGQSAAGGTAQQSVRAGQARVGGVPLARGTAPVNRARPPRLAGGSQWDCPWPEEGDMADEDEPTVTLRVQVTSTGQVRKITVVQDPGYGFGQEARRCAMRKRWQPALDPTGRPTEKVALVAVRFRS